MNPEQIPFQFFRWYEKSGCSIEDMAKDIVKHGDTRKFYEIIRKTIESTQEYCQKNQSVL